MKFIHFKFANTFHSISNKQNIFSSVSKKWFKKQICFQRECDVMLNCLGLPDYRLNDALKSIAYAK